MTYAAPTGFVVEYQLGPTVYIDPGNDRNEQRAIARIERILTRCGYLVMRNDKELHVMCASWLNDND